MPGVSVRDGSVRHVSVGVSVRVCGVRHVSMVFEGCECEGWGVRHVSECEGMWCEACLCGV